MFFTIFMIIMMIFSGNVEWRFEVAVFKQLGSTDSQVYRKKYPELQGTVSFSSLHLNLGRLKHWRKLCFC